jgi:hypothetical protein
MSDSQWEEYWRYLKPQVNIIWTEIRNLLLLDPAGKLPGYFRHREQPGGVCEIIPSQLPFPIPRVLSEKVHQLQGQSRSPVNASFAPSSATLTTNHSLIRRPLSQNLRGDLYKAAGIKPNEISTRKQVLSGSLSDINDRDLTIGPFRLALTDDPRFHLRFDNTKQEPTILILDTRSVCILSILDFTGIME